MAVGRRCLGCLEPQRLTSYRNRGIKTRGCLSPDYAEHVVERGKARTGNFGFSLCRDFVRCSFLPSTAARTSLRTRHGYSVAIVARPMWYHNTSRRTRFAGDRATSKPTFAAAAWCREIDLAKDTWGPAANELNGRP